MRVLVCGGRNYSDRETVFRTLDRVRAKHPDLEILQGAARGADSLAHEWALAREVVSISVPARWKADGQRSAGPKRNFRMLKHWAPDAVVAFPGGSGTAHMVHIAREAGVPVMVVGDE